jgi:hypothetical protein
MVEGVEGNRWDNYRGRERAYNTSVWGDVVRTTSASLRAYELTSYELRRAHHSTCDRVVGYLERTILAVYEENGRQSLSPFSTPNTVP